jgi:sulfite reductase alpha subunit-like flavoprotein
MIAKAGGTRIIERGAGDAAGDFFGAFEAWKENLFQVLRKTTGIENIIGEEKLSIEIVNSTRNLGQITDIGIVKENKILVKANDINSTIQHLEIELPKGQAYRSGDYLAILPTNPIQVVHRVLLASLRIRQYSISSSPLWNSESVTITFDIVDAPAISGYGKYFGVTLNYLSNLKKGDRLCCSVSSK